MLSVEHRDYLRARALAAVKEFNRDEEAFLRKYKYGRSRKYDLIHEGRRYPPKAIWGLASASDASSHERPFWLHGGEQSNRRLRELGFVVVPKDAFGALTDDDIACLPRQSDDYAIQVGIRYRRGQKRFRNSLLKIYDGKCVVTGCSIEALLDAAHIRPYSDLGDYSPGNGILLRTDIHTLFDAGLLRIHPDTRRIDLNPIIDDRGYQRLHGKKIAEPKQAKYRIDAANLEIRWQAEE